MVQKVFRFISHDMWRIRAKKLPYSKSVSLRALRIFVLSFSEFNKDKCSLHASALTFFSLLSIVPVFAMAFGIAKGFGLETMLHERLAAVEGQQEILQKVVQFSETMLQNTKGGLIAGVGVMLLFWSVINVLQNIEKSFNHIFAVKKERTLTRKLADYMTIMLICPILVILSGSVTVFISTQITNIVHQTGQAGALVGPYMLKLLRFLPFAIFWLLLTFLYVVMPNTRVKIKSAFYGALVAGTLYQLVQVLYIKSQMVASNLGAIYGSFAALPLFLTWLQLSWQIVLYGAELAFAHQNEETYEFEDESRNASIALQKIVGLLLARTCIKNFCEGKKPVEVHAFAHEYEIPIRLARMASEKLKKAGILCEIEDDTKQTELYYPARDVNDLSMEFILSAWDNEGSMDLGVEEKADFNKLKTAMMQLRQSASASPSNLLLKSL